MPTPKLSDEVLREAVDAVAQYGTPAEAAKALGIADSTLRHRLMAAAQRGNAPGHWTSGTAPGFIVDRVNITRGKDGVERTHERQVPEGQLDASAIPATHIKGRLTVTSGPNGIERIHQRYMPDEARQAEVMRAAAEAMAESLPRVKAIHPPADTNKALCNLYILTDSHVGMLAWHREGGADWDLRIAEQTLTGCFMRMVDNAPKAADAVIAQLGDFLHFDSLLPVTPGHGHVLDADSRFGKMVAVAVRILRRVVDYALAKHDRVFVVMAQGNHDEVGAVWLRVMFAALYENEPRVVVNDSELPYYVHRHGETMLAFHHGHKSKNDALPILFASQYPGIWGATSKRYAHTGHRHHHEEKEHSGMTVTQHPTLAARDAYAARGGWISERQASAITYHSRFGRVGVTIVSPDMLEAA